MTKGKDLATALPARGHLECPRYCVLVRIKIDDATTLRDWVDLRMGFFETHMLHVVHVQQYELFRYS